MEYLADTVALIRHLSGTGRIGKAAKEILKAADQGEHIIYISIISMVEIMYLAEGNRIPVDFRTIKNKIIKSDNYHIIDLDMEIVETAKEIRGLELHDRLIVATGKYLKIPILTCDRSIQESSAIRTIWTDNF
jgi:PIN domain nuclease of toxin-antitoxin system